MRLYKNGRQFSKILVIPDLHTPFMDWKAVQVVAKWAKKHEPDLIIQLGDLLDFKAWSRWPKDPDDYSPHDEFEFAIEATKRLYNLFPNMEILMGNHDLRIAKRALDVGFTRHILRDLQDVFPYEGWNWWSNPKERLIVNTQRGPILFQHGDEQAGNAIQKARLFGVSVVQGHDHQARIDFSETLSASVFGASAGHLMDQSSKGARYAQRNGRYPVKGYMIIKFGVPYFIPIVDGENKV